MSDAESCAMKSMIAMVTMLLLCYSAAPLELDDLVRKCGKVGVDFSRMNGEQQARWWQLYEARLEQIRAQIRLLEQRLDFSLKISKTYGQREMAEARELDELRQQEFCGRSINLRMLGESLGR